MEALDFSRSFLTFRIDTLKKATTTTSHKPPYSLNNARIQIECRCQIKEKRNGRVHQFVMGANCKTEQVGVERDIWLQPNADFVPIFSDEKFLQVKTYAKADDSAMLYPPSLGIQSERQVWAIAGAFDSLRIDLYPCEGKVLATVSEINESTLANEPLIARTEIETDRYQALIEYPVKTMNANDREGIYQTDTGPVLLPDLSREPDELIEGMELAFVAFNSPDWAEFIVRTKQPVSEGISVYHYCKAVRYDCKNQLVAILK
jgi:hypothetical protein